MKQLYRLCLIFIFSLIVSRGAAQQLPQQWIREFIARGKCSDRVSKILADNSGNIYVGGYASHKRAYPDAFVMKRNAQGDTLWTYYYDGGTSGEDYVLGMALDNAGNVYITGKSQATFTGNFDCFTAKLNAAGVQQWVTRYPSGTGNQSFGNAVAVDGNGSVYVAGYIDPASNSNNWLVVKYNSSGVQQWADVLNGPGNGEDEAMDIAISPLGNPTVCGHSYSVSASGGINIFVKQYNAAGGTVWTDTYTNPSVSGTDMAKGLGFSAAGNLYVGGETSLVTGFNRDVVVLCYNPAGVRQWASVYTDTISQDDYVLGVAVDQSGDTYVAGTNYSNGCLVKVSATGVAEWKKIWAGPLPFGNDITFSVATDNNGGVYTTGRGVYPGPDYYGNGGMANMYISKYNSAGDSLWTYRYADSTAASMGTAITCLNGKVYAGGFKTDTAYVDEDLYTIILDTSGNSLYTWRYNGYGYAITRGQFVRTDAQNNVYCAASCDRYYQGGYDVAIVKYGPAGNLLWERYYTTPGWNNDTITAMEINPAGELVLCISSDTGQVNNNYRLSLVTLDANGNFLDTAWYLPSPLGSTHACSMQIRSDGSVVVGANSNINGGLLLYFNNQHVFQWAAKLDSTAFAATKINSVALFPNGDIAVAGYTQPGAGNTARGLVQRFDPSGNRLWTADYDSANVFDEAKDVTVSPGGQVAVVGLSGYSTTGLSALITYDGATGQQVWRQVYNPNTTNEYGVKVRYTPAGNIAYICRGWTGFVARYTTLQYSPGGAYQWATVYSQTASDREPLELLVEPNNRVVTAGWAINTATTNFDYVLVGYNSSGVQQFLNNYTTSGLQPDRLSSLARDGFGNFIVTGESADDFLNNYLFKMVTIKYGGSAVGMEEVNAVTNVIAYPNPSGNGRFMLLDASGETPITRGRVFDISGKMVATLDILRQEINLSNFPAGLYLLQFERENIPAGTIKLIVE